jgi:hypothetical protein
MTGSKNWSAGDVLNAADVNSILADQVVMTFADSSARDAGFGGAGEPTLAEGMVCFLADTNVLQIYTGAAWVAVADTDVMIINGKNVGVGTGTPTGFGGTNLEVYDTGIAGLLVNNGEFVGQFHASASGVIMGTRSNHGLIINTNNATRITITAAGAVTVGGDFTVSGTKNFDIPHPTKGGDWRLRHSSVEAPRADLIYRGTVTLAGGTATVDLDEASNMTDGTWEALCRDPWTMVASSGNAVEWSLSGKTLTITGPADAVCNWMVIAERHDDHMKGDDCLTCDDDGHLVVEYEREPSPPLP